jgi:hypothetical protein
LLPSPIEADFRDNAANYCATMDKSQLNFR